MCLLYHVTVFDKEEALHFNFRSLCDLAGNSRELQ